MHKFLIVVLCVVGLIGCGGKPKPLQVKLLNMTWAHETHQEFDIEQTRDKPVDYMAGNGQLVCDDLKGKRALLYLNAKLDGNSHEREVLIDDGIGKIALSQKGSTEPKLEIVPTGIVELRDFTVEIH